MSTNETMAVYEKFASFGLLMTVIGIVMVVTHYVGYNQATSVVSQTDAYMTVEESNQGFGVRVPSQSSGWVNDGDKDLYYGSIRGYHKVGSIVPVVAVCTEDKCTTHTTYLSETTSMQMVWFGGGLTAVGVLVFGCGLALAARRDR